LDNSSINGANGSASSAAEEVGLVYVSDKAPGYTRRRKGRGFAYLSLTGETVRDAELRARFEALVIPPAWTEVWICADSCGHIQATGRDEKGRKQYIYHPKWDEARSQTKFGRLLQFAEALPALRRRVDEDLRKRTLSREKVLAIVLRLLDETLIRVGNLEYARQNNSYGLTTLQDEHIEVRGSRVTFTFRGKSGKEQEIDLHSQRLARLVKSCQELPGQQLFQYLGDDGSCCITVSSTDVNQYLRESTGQDFSAKDFRTWGATVLAAVELYEIGPAASATARKKNLSQAVKNTAHTLGNTPTVCRGYYIHPAVFAAYESGNLFRVFQETLAGPQEGRSGLDRIETAVMRLLQTAADVSGK
jgi:DNA topoisomerase-1